MPNMANGIPKGQVKTAVGGESCEKLLRKVHAQSTVYELLKNKERIC